jgi:hypothetical protein
MAIVSDSDRRSPQFRATAGAANPAINHHQITSSRRAAQAGKLTAARRVIHDPHTGDWLESDASAGQERAGRLVV